MKYVKKIWRFLAFILFLSPVALSAHEVYVLPKDVAESGLQNSNINPFLALTNSSNLKTTIIIGAAISLAIVFYFFLQHSRIGRYWSKKWERLASFGPVIIRLVVAISFFFSAYSLSFLGPELSLTAFPSATFIQLALFILSIFIFFGLFTEYAAILAMIIFSIAISVFHGYMITYVNYVGEFLALILFGSRYFSLDGLFFGSRRLFEKYRKYESLLVRVCYGFGLIFSAIYIKILHAVLTLDVVNDYNLTQFSLLFPHDPLLVVLGAALAEITIGLFIIFGFELRLTVLVALFYMTLSLLFFRELVWPHLILYGISFSLLFAPTAYSMDSWFDKKIQLFREKRPL